MKNRKLAWAALLLLLAVYIFPIFVLQFLTAVYMNDALFKVIMVAECLTGVAGIVLGIWGLVERKRGFEEEETLRDEDV